MNMNQSTNQEPDAQASAWQLRAQVILPGEAGSAERAAGLAVEAVRDLNLPPAQLRSIREAVADAARQINAGRDAHQPALPISLTLLVAGDRAGISGASGPPPPAGNVPERRGWGCFVIQRRADNAPAAGAGARLTVELFLYPEGTSRIDDPA
jgi:hypothetical protein